MLAIGIDIEELDSDGRTPLVHAVVKHREAICNLLLEKGASLDSLQTFTRGMDLKEKSELFDPLITRCLGNGSTSVYIVVLRFLVPIVLGIYDGEVSNGSPSQSMMKVAIDMNYGLAIYAIIQLEPQVLVDGRAAICNLLLEKVESVEALKVFTSGMTSTKRFQLLHPSARSMHDVVKKDYKSILVLLTLIESCDSEGWTPLASAAFNNDEALCEFLVANGCNLCLDTEQKKHLKPQLSYCIHVATERGHKATLQLLLDMGADIGEIGPDKYGRTALLEAIHNNHLPCVKLLIEWGADATISSNYQWTVLHYAAYAGHEQIIKFLLDNVVEARKLVDMQDCIGNTALHSCGSGNGNPVAVIEIAKMLLQAGATLTTKNKQSQIPYECARDLGKKELARYLWSQLSPEQQAQERPPPSYW